MPPRLREERKRIQRKLVGATTQSALGVAVAVGSGGLTLIFSGIGARRIDVNRQRCAVIEALLKERGWPGHELGLRDIWAGVVLGAAATSLAPGADHVADQAINHLHHGTDQFAGRFQGTTSTGLGTAAVHGGTHLAIKQGTAWLLNSDSSPVSSTEQNPDTTTVGWGLQWLRVQRC